MLLRLSSRFGSIQWARRRQVFNSVLLVSILLTLLAAAIWDRWPGDIELLQFLRGAVNNEPFRTITPWLNRLGDPVEATFMTVIAMGWLIRQGLARPAVTLGIIIALQVSLAQLAKWIVHRPRPILQDFQALVDVSGSSFPSVHVVFVATFFGCLLYLLDRYSRGTGWRRWSVIALLMGPVILIGFARIAAGAHWPSDVLGGYLFSYVGLLALGRFQEPNRPSFFVSAQGSLVSGKNKRSPSPTSSISQGEVFEGSS